MFTDGRTVDSGAVLQTDVCIVGAGAAGITIAREFSEGDLRVCLVESGDLDFKWDVQSLSKGRNIGLPYFDLDVCQIRYFGGATNAWGGWCRRLEPLDFRERPWVENSGWPFGPEELAPWYDRAQDLCELEQPAADLAGWMARLAGKNATMLDTDPAWLETTMYQFSPPTRFGRVYREDIQRNGRIDCLLNSHVIGVRTGENARSVTHIDVATLSGKRFRVEARYFILAANGIENARLLLISNDVQPAGLGNTAGLVGRYFMEHPHTKRTIVPIDPRAQIGLYGLAFHGQHMAARLALPAAVQEREQLLNYSANLHQVYWAHESNGWLAFRKLVLSLLRSRSTDPYVRFPPYGRKGLELKQAFDIIKRLDQVAIAGMLEWLKPTRMISKFVIESKPEQAPNPDSRVVLSADRDAFGLQRADLDWRTLAIDRRTAIRGEEIVDRELRRLGIGMAVPLSEQEKVEWPTNLEGGWHQIGTTRMHADPRHGVVDPNSRVHHVENLFIAGSSVFPTGGVTPPTLTTVALSLRLAGHVKSLLRDERRVRQAAPVALVTAS